VDRSYVLASKYFDRHTSYVALSRHREAATLFYGQDEFANPRGQGGTLDPAEAKRNLEYTLSRARPKELAHDYLDLGRAGLGTAAAEEHADNPPDAIQARAREAWAAFRAKDLQSGASPEEIQRLARERWQEYRRGQGSESAGAGQDKSNTQGQDHGKDDDQTL
jgi:hypothetical protein